MGGALACGKSRVHRPVSNPGSSGGGVHCPVGNLGYILGFGGGNLHLSRERYIDLWVNQGTSPFGQSWFL